MTDKTEVPELPLPFAHWYWSHGRSTRRVLAGAVLPPNAAPLFTADQMREYALQALAARAPGAVAEGGLRDWLQRKCSDWGTYWRAPDAHGVVLNMEQALELLGDALGVEVEITAAPAPAEAKPAELGDEAMRRAYYAGWCNAAKWAKRDDLRSDEGSAAYERDLQAALRGEAAPGATVIELEAHRPHRVGDAQCASCRHRWVAVIPEGRGVVQLECPSCHRLSGQFTP